MMFYCVDSLDFDSGFVDIEVFHFCDGVLVYGAWTLTLWGPKGGSKETYDGDAIGVC